MTPLDALECAIARGGTPSVLAIRYPRGRGRPGEIIERLDTPVREALGQLRSGDVDIHRAPRLAPWLAPEEVLNPGLLAYRNATARFDRQVLHLTPGPRTTRRQHMMPR